MIQGTASHAGKSLMATALCRIFSDMGYKVAPFKSQNMSLNSCVNESGDEIARSQIVQAMAARVKPIAEHNPILLKPKSDNSSQIILMGKLYADYTVKEYYKTYIPQLIPHIHESLEKLKRNNDIIVIEGAGSPAEINIMDGEIANMYVAKYLKAPVLLCSDIDRGGVFASIYGTIKLLKQEEQDLIKFFVINKFRGNLDLLTDGIKQIERLVGKKCLGVVPFIQDLRIPAEDSVSLEDKRSQGIIKIKVIQLPRISNFNDFEALEWEPEVHLSYTSNPDDLKDCDLIIIPGTKNTINDLSWMKQKGFFSKLRDLKESGKIIVGICGGYQILGEKIIDNAIEGDLDKEFSGLGFLPIKTEFKAYKKTTRQVISRMIGFPQFNGLLIEGYEIHMGEITYLSNAHPLLQIEGELNANKEFDGAINETHNVFGSFIHDFWNNNEFRKKFIQFLASRNNYKNVKVESKSYQEIVEFNIEKLANSVRNNIDMKALLTELGI
ncbi:MAG: cobyric acid synthase [Candidatus Lokiarchaeota archaeon]|nr:cobyric acid synthase [Candidatus Lokiarchaeota archaeon]